MISTLPVNEIHKDSPVVRRRKSSKIADWALIYKAFEESGLSKREFCISREIPYSKFLYHYAKYLASKIPEPEARFLPIKMQETAKIASAPQGLVLHYPSGLKISLPHTADATTFKMIISVMRDLP